MLIKCVLFTLIAALIPLAKSQIPSFGGCPVYAPMPGFDKERFLGTWYEAERYFTVTELATRCIEATYEKRADGKIYVNNAVVNRFTGVQRIISGTMKTTGKTGEGKYVVSYTSPINYDTTLNVLDTDYKSFAVIWSCNGIGPVGHTESAWVMTRERLPTGPVLQRAYGVLDKYQISRTFFLKSDQSNCDTIAEPQEAYDPTTEISANNTRTFLKNDVAGDDDDSRADGAEKNLEPQIIDELNPAPIPVIIMNRDSEAKLSNLTDTNDTTNLTEEKIDGSASDDLNNKT